MEPAMPHQMEPITPPKPDPDARWCCPEVQQAYSLVMDADYMAPAYNRGDAVYCCRSNRLRESGGDYILVAGAGLEACYVMASLQRATGSSWHGLIYGWNRDRAHFRKTPVRLSRAKWRLAFRVRGCLRARCLVDVRDDT
jgi:hypothetical protein